MYSLFPHIVEVIKTSTIYYSPSHIRWLQTCKAATFVAHVASSSTTTVPPATGSCWLAHQSEIKEQTLRTFLAVAYNLLANLCLCHDGVGVAEVINVSQSVDVTLSVSNPPAELGLVVAVEVRVETVLPQGIAGDAVLLDRLNHGLLHAVSGLMYPYLPLKYKYIFVLFIVFKLDVSWYLVIKCINHAVKAVAVVFGMSQGISTRSTR